MTTIIESKYENIRDECLAAGKLWEDPNFPADGTSIGPNPKTVKPKWRRPHEVCDKMAIPPPEFIIEEGDRFDINQGGLADCWMLAAVASITSSPQLFKRVVPHDQTFQRDKYAGVFRFHFWQFGKWVEVLVDDRLPMAYGELLYVKSKTPNEFWAPLLEKAYAKLYGSYQVIEYGMCDEALVDFTGALAQHFSLEEFTSKDLAGIMFKASERNSIISSTVQDPECAEKKGLVAGHSYSITGVKKVQLEDEVKRCLLRVRNPWGQETEWKGRWSDSSKEWDKISPKAREEFGLVKKDDGEFWIQFSDFLRNFQTVEICNLDVADLFDCPGGAKCWSTSIFYGKWIKNETAGGQKVDSPTFSKNPQFKIVLNDHDEDDDVMASFVVELTQMNRRQLMLNNLTIGFYIYRVPPEAPLPLSHDFLVNVEHKGGKDIYEAVRAVVKNFTVEPGVYVIIPTTENEDEEGEFMVRVFSESNHQYSEIQGCST